MATITAYGSKPGVAIHLPNSANLCTSKNTDGVTDVVDRGGLVSGPALIHVARVGTGSPTQTYLIEGSPDNANWFPAVYADVTTPTTLAFIAFTLSAAAGTQHAWKIVQPNVPWRYLRVTISATTTSSATIDAFVF